MKRVAISLLSLLVAGAAPAQTATDRAARQFVRAEMTIKTRSVPLAEAQAQLPGAAAWDAFRARYGDAVGVFVDARSGVPSNVAGGIPLLPGDGQDNRVTLDDVGRRLGRAVASVDETVVRDAVRAFTRENAAAFAIDVDQLGEGRAVRVRDGFWQVSLPQQFRGVPVRYARVLATIKGGNLLLFGAQTWAPVALDTTPRVSPSAALDAAFAAVGGRTAADELLDTQLEIVPTEAEDPAPGQVLAGGDAGRGYGHRLVWSFRFQRPDELPLWEALVDAHDGGVLSFQDVSDSVRRPMTGRVYSPTNTEVCPSPGNCGVTQSVPMPFADTGLAPPFQATNSAGLFVDHGLPVTTTLSGPYVKIHDACGPTSETAQGTALDLSGGTGQHDCDTPPGASAGNTSAARGTFYELNKLMEMARGWLPDMPFLSQPIPARVNLNSHCNANYNPQQNTLNFFEGGDGCRNTGEIATIIDHEWGHALDFHDVAGKSNTSEGFADVAAIYRQGVSCIAHGMFHTSDLGCGQSSDGAGFNAEESDGGPGAPHCALDCAGVRDADWARHAHNSPDTALGFVCGSCRDGGGPCGRAVHCAGAPIRQAAWDLVARDLQAAPYHLDFNTALILGNRLFYEGSGNVHNWYECNCGHGTSGGCAADNGYMQWLAADDDDGNLSDGTPHLAAIRNAFARHGIGCTFPVGPGGGCAGKPATAPQVTLTSGSDTVTLSWTAVAGAHEYWVFRSEGRDACRLGKTRIARVSGLSYTDIQVANDRSYCYSVTAVGASDECLGPASGCACRTPQALNLACDGNGPAIRAGETGTRACRLTAGEGANGRATLSCAGLPGGVQCGFTPNPASPPADSVGEIAVGLVVAPSAATGTFDGEVVATYDSGEVRKAPLSVQVLAQPPAQAFELSCPDQVTLAPGTQLVVECRVQSSGGFAKPVALGCGTGQAPGLSCAVQPATVTPPANGSVAARLRIAAAPGTAGGPHTAVTVGGTSAGVVRQAIVGVVVLPPTE